MRCEAVCEQHTASYAVSPTYWVSPRHIMFKVCTGRIEGNIAPRVADMRVCVYSSLNTRPRACRTFGVFACYHDLVARAGFPIVVACNDFVMSWRGRLTQLNDPACFAGYRSVCAPCPYGCCNFFLVIHFPFSVLRHPVTKKRCRY